MSKVFLIFYFISGFLFSQSDLLRQLEFADSLYFSQNYFDAIKEYKRVVFFDKEKSLTYYSYNQIANCYKYGRKFEDSYNFFSLALIEAKSSKEIFDCKINICRLNIIEKKTKNAHKILDELEKDLLFCVYEKEIKFWRAWTFFFERDYQKAKNIFKELDKSELANLSEKLLEDSYSVQTAKILSTILPGMGQFYTGNYLNGLGSLLWNLLSGYLTISALSNERIFDGIVLSNFLWLRFYKGNLENAEKFAIDENEKIFNESLNFIYSNFSKEIP